MKEAWLYEPLRIVIPMVSSCHLLPTQHRKYNVGHPRTQKIMFMEIKLSWQQKRSCKYYKNSKLTKPFMKSKIHSFMNAFEKQQMVFYLHKEEII